MLFKNFFVVSGAGVSDNSSLVAFDRALLEAGIAQCNLVPVSSILPVGAKQVKPTAIVPGNITFTVMSRQEGFSGEEITAGIAWAESKLEGKETYGMVVEDHGNKSKAECERNLKSKLEEMALARNMIIVKYESRVSTLKNIPKKNFGCVVSALIYV